MRHVHIVSGWLEAVALGGFAVSIVANANKVHSTVGKPEAEAVIYAVFGVLLALLSMLLRRKVRAARTPFGLLQVFAVIVGLTFLAGTSSAAKSVGVAVTAAGAIAFVSLVRASRA